MGEMPQAAPADGGLEDAEDGTPITTGGGDGAAAQDTGAEDAGDDAAGDDAVGPDDGGTTGGMEGEDGDTAPGESGSDGGDGGDGDGGDEAGTTTGEGDTSGSSGDAAGSDSAGDDGPLPDAIDVSDYELVQTEAFRVVTLPAGTVVPAGAYLVIGRDATRAEFEAFWGPLPADAVYLDGAVLDEGTFPTINGDESYELLDPSGAGVDGPTAPLAMLGNLQRVDPGEPAALAPSWQSSADPDGDATPGAGQIDSAVYSGIYISEVSDAVGSGNFVFEFVELYHDP